MNLQTKITDLQGRIKKLTHREATLTGELTQCEARGKEIVKKLKEEFGVDSVEAAKTKVAELEKTLQRDALTLEKLVKKAEGILNGGTDVETG